MTDRSRLESTLGSLADSIDWPTPSPHLPARVLALIEAEPTTAVRSGRRRLAIAMAAVVVVAGVMVFSPSARQAVADLFGAAGIRISLTTQSAPTAGSELNLGEPIPLDDIGPVVDFAVRIPAGDDPGPPDGVYLSDNGQVTMVWADSETLPAAGDTNVALLLVQRKAYDFQYFGEKGIGPETAVDGLQVEGRPALWIEGAPHTLTLLDADGNPVEETTRLAANVLLWEVNGVNLRLETTGDLQSSLALVETMEALP
jgi:hypothetical protein